MPAYTTRVELLDAAADYTALTGFMQQAGFVDFIVDDQNQKYTLPTGEYFSHGELSIIDVCANAEWAAKQTGGKFRMFVTEGGNRSWVGLDAVNPV
ncbi:hypothetical protein [Amantichitinum ursilacus]|uniref:Uncharacterized protein n=1 Tax=Amantichitinum ursilacus TaxID=857265 RepID=A0A0N0GL25_9NEIS|nr:hypothetical protein [Amantichitinum ursilacus]KPC49546.1 hypothetical protein WG78_19520 [Amantichitinum ursilacus]